jgi:hypothetical protein
VERQDLRSVLRLFAEIASSVSEEERSDMQDEAEGGADLAPRSEEQSWVSSTTR